MSQIVSFWDDALNKYVEVSETNPLPTNAVGGGTGGAEEVEVTSWTATQTVKVDQQSALPAGTNNIGSVAIASGNGSGLKAEVYPYANVASWTTTDNALAVAAFLGGYNGTNFERLSSTSGSLHVIGTVGVNAVPVVGAHANAWNAAAVAANGTSTAIDCQYVSHISVFGNSTVDTTITLQYSQNNTDFYDDDLNTIQTGIGNFAFNVTAGARYLRLKSSAAATITATIAGKG